MLTDGGAGYCSDITRCVYTGEPPAEFAELYAVLHAAQARGGRRRHGRARRASEVDAAARVDHRRRPATAEHFFHRTGHGIGVEEHEDPYIVAGNDAAARGRQRLLGRARHLRARAAGALGSRTSWSRPTDGPRSLNVVDHDLVVVDA